MDRLAILSVHYLDPALLLDQFRRLSLCVDAAREALGLEPWFHPILHGKSRPAVAAAAADVERLGGIATKTVDLRGVSRIRHPHGDALVEAFLQLEGDHLLGPRDWIAILDHDCHPLRPSALADLGGKLQERGEIAEIAGIGIPQWHRGHCYLHPSFLLTRVATVLEMGPDQAFRGSYPETGPGLRDTAERFTVWCEEAGRPTYPLRVISTAFPWERWDSDMAAGGSPRLTGEHGESVHAGYLMRYGIDEARPLLSHLWAAPLHGHRFGGGYETSAVLSAYLSEPMEA